MILEVDPSIVKTLLIFFYGMIGIGTAFVLAVAGADIKRELDFKSWYKRSRDAKHVYNSNQPTTADIRRNFDIVKSKIEEAK